MWIGRYLGDLLEYLAIMHPAGVLAELGGKMYKVTVTPARKAPDNG